MIESLFNFQSDHLHQIYKPSIFRLANVDEKQAFERLFAHKKVSFVHDEIRGQLQELIKSNNPSVRIPEASYENYINEHLNGNDINEYGVWVYYPWSQRMVHLLDEDEFSEVRTNRNQYKITRQERSLLSTKRIGIIGLSVGQSIALTLAMERSFSELRLADFDTLELSNLNRIRTGAHNLGVPKVVIAAREIAEIDPFLDVTCFFDGLTEDNMEEFFTNNGKLDILIDECDGLDIKILSRYKAREHKIPVLMDTSDRGMLDIERFDLEPERPILHGTVANVNPHNIKELSNEDKIPIILQMLGADNISLRGKASMVEVQQTINTWPQLASSVALGGAVGADVCRRILLDQFHESGRYYIDLDELVADKEPAPQAAIQPNPFLPLTAAEMLNVSAGLRLNGNPDDIAPDTDTIKKLVKAAIAAPSTGNDQPWKWLYQKGTLYLYHDEYRSFSFGDFKKTASFITFGAAFENLYIHGLTLGFKAYYEFLPLGENQRIVAAIRFVKADKSTDQFLLNPLDQAIFHRCTNRNSGVRTELSQDIFNELTRYTESVDGAKLYCFTADTELSNMGAIIGACDKTRILNPAGHYDFVHREMRWTHKEAEETMDGIDVKTLGLGNSQLAALDVIKDEKVIQLIKSLGGGGAFNALASKTVASASALCLITLPRFELKSFFEGGRAMERFWLAATNLNLAVHPLISPLYLFSRLLHGNGEGLDTTSMKELKILRQQFNDITGIKNEHMAEVFLAKIGIADEPALKAHRIPVDQVLITD